MKKLLVAVFVLALLAIAGVLVAQKLLDVPSAQDSPYAAFIDTHRVAVAKGATAEWRKLEWLAVNRVSGQLLVTSSNLASSMSDDTGDMQFAEIRCGAILGGPYDENMNVTRLEVVLPGGAYDAGNADNPCDVDAIAGPDNLYVDPTGGLWIGEDTTDHLNNVLWMWDGGSQLKRFATLPLGAEVTGLHIADDGTLFLNVQHPDASNQAPFNVGTIGVITGFKAGDDFTSLTVPTTDQEKTTLRLAAGEYQMLGRSGDAIPGSNMIFGTNITHDGSITSVCEKPDGNMFIRTSDTTAILYTNFECQVGGVSQLDLAVADDGSLSIIDGLMLDFISVNGTTNNCGASVTPWGTALTSEEHPADNAANWAVWLTVQSRELRALLGKAPNPFDQGYNVELIPADDGSTQIIKRYALGRLSKEVAIVMPDNKTLYMGDDGTDRIFTKFVADTAGDLSAGTLYAAKVRMDGDAAITLEWIELGHGAEAEIFAAIRQLDAQFAQ